MFPKSFTPPENSGTNYEVSEKLVGLGLTGLDSQMGSFGKNCF
jgi:hypothetical protein